MPDSQGLQLLQKKHSNDRAEGGGLFFALSASALVLVAVAYGGLWWWSNGLIANIASADNELSSIESARDKNKEKRLLATYTQLDQIEPILRSHVFMSRALTRVQALVQSRIQAASLSVDSQKKTISLKGVADNFTTVSKQISSFYLEPSFENVVLQRVASMKDGRVDFDLIIEFSANKLLIDTGDIVNQAK